MDFFTIFVISLIPGLLWVWFFYRQDRDDKEPFKLILVSFFGGMIAVIPAALWESPFRQLIVDPPNMLVRFLVAFLVIGLGEEAFKLLSVYVTAYRRDEFNEPSDGIIYSVTASLGFASLENAFYTAAFGLAVAPVRAIITSLAHASFGGVAGLYLACAKLRHDVGWIDVLKGLGIAAFLHGLYDFLIMARLVHPFFAFFLIFITYRYVAVQLAKLSQQSPFRP